VGPRDGLDDVHKRKFLILPGLEPQLFGHPARRQSLYRLRYPGSAAEVNFNIFLKFLRHTEENQDKSQQVN
jgi:hypothetical protein